METTRRGLLAAGVAAVGLIGPAVGQGKPVSLKAGNPERKKILDALRVRVSRQLKQPVIFEVHHLKAQNGFAFVLATPRRPNGTAIDYSKTPYAEARREGAFDDGVCALLKREKGRWRTLQHVIGATDVPYEDWDRRYKAPSGIFR